MYVKTYKWACLISQESRSINEFTCARLENEGCLSEFHCFSVFGMLLYHATTPTTIGLASGYTESWYQFKGGLQQQCVDKGRANWRGRARQGKKFYHSLLSQRWKGCLISHFCNVFENMMCEESHQIWVIQSETNKSSRTQLANMHKCMKHRNYELRKMLLVLSTIILSCLVLEIQSSNNTKIPIIYL